MKPTRSAIVVAGLAIALIGGCAGQTGSGGGGGAAGGGTTELSGRQFLSTAVTEGGQPRIMAEGTTVSLRFTDDGRLLADAGCNTMQSPVEITDGKLAVSDLAVTTMGCDPQRHDQDTWLAEFLQAGPAVRLDGTDLTLSSGDTELTLVDREVAQPDVALEGTTWVVDTLVSGDTASSVPSGAAPASLTFGPDTVDVATGCNTGSTSYQVDGTKLTFGEVTITRKACSPDIMQLEETVLAVVSGETTFELDADRLVLEHPSGTGLHLRAEG